MTPGNEAYRELEDRIADQQASIRTESWGDLVNRYNQGKITIERMLREARSLQGQSTGERDNAQWTSTVSEWIDRRDDERQAQLEQDWQNRRTSGASVLDFLDSRIAGMTRGTEEYNQLTRHREDIAKTIRSRDMADKDTRQNQLYQDGKISDDAYLTYWERRLKNAPAGSDEKRDLRAQVKNLSFSLSEKRLTAGYLQTGDASGLLDLYAGAQAGMIRGSSAWNELQSQILDLQSKAFGTIDILSQGGPGGHTVGTGPINIPNLGIPVNRQGFASQFDGSQFASTNCGFASAAMLAWSAGVTGLSGGDLRWYAGNPSGASYLSDIANAFNQVGLGLDQQRGMSLEAFRKRVAGGEGAILNGLYGNLTGQQRLSDFSGAHSVFVERAMKKDGVWYYLVRDPIARSAAAGSAWWPEEVVRRFAWSGATNPITGNELTGVAAFATGKGKGRIVNRGGAVPFQAFDTDSNGRSTLGKGGGANRQEAGFMPTRFETRLRKGEKQKKVDKIAVESFLGAVSRAGSPNEIPDTEKGEEAWRKRARRLLTKYDGDPRLAAMEWFTNTEAERDTAKWTDGQRFYVNSVSKQYGLAQIPQAGIGVIDPKDPVQPSTVGAAPAGTGAVNTSGARVLTQQVTDTGATVTTAAEADSTTTPTSPADQGPGPDAVVTTDLSGYSAESQDIALKFLAAIGADNAGPDMVKAVITWMAAEWGGVDNIPATDPFHIITTSDDQLPGQTGRNPDGSAQFTGVGVDPTQAAITAAAAYIEQAFPTIAGAWRTGDPKAVFRAYETAGWSSATTNNNLARTSNSLPGGPDYFGLPTYLDTPKRFADLARTVPDVEMLFNIDVLDPVQRAWRDEQIGRLLNGVQGTATEWIFTPPGGEPMTLPFDPMMAIEMSDVAFIQDRQLAAYSPPTATRRGRTRSPWRRSTGCPT